MDIASLLQQGEGQSTNFQDDLFLQELMTSQQVSISYVTKAREMELSRL